MNNVGYVGTSAAKIPHDMAMPATQPELASIYDRLDSLGNSLGILECRLTGMAGRALGATPEPGQPNGTVKAVPDGAVGRVNEVIDGIAYVTERIRTATERLERLV